MKTRLVLLIAVLSSLFPLTGAKAQRAPRTVESLEYLAQRAGADPEALDRFSIALSDEARRVGKKLLKEDLRSLSCFDGFTDSFQGRTSTLRCLSDFGLSGLHARAYGRLLELRIERVSHSRDIESNRSVALIAYLEDLVRENLHRQGRPAGWYTRGDGNGFGATDGQMDFAFEDGDIVLGLGNSSISSLISQVTEPQGRYSHAFIVRVRDGKITTLESLIETGVREFSYEHFKKDTYNHLTVLRWKDANRRALVAARASDIARRYSKMNLPYDSAIDLDNDKKMFCTELVVRSYADAAGLDVRELLPQFAQVRSEDAFDYVKNLGVSNREFVSPGDLFESSHLEIVADYRRPDDLFRAWKLYLMGDVFLERVEQGYRIQPGPIYALVPIAAWIAQLLPSIFIEDARLIPKSMTPLSLSIIATAERKVFWPAIEHADDEAGGKSLLETSLWRYRGLLKEFTRTNWIAKFVFVPKSQIEAQNRGSTTVQHDRP